MERLFGKRALHRVLDCPAELTNFVGLLLARQTEPEFQAANAYVVHLLGCVVSERPLVARSGRSTNQVSGASLSCDLAACQR
jgi:hypothetical protein